MQGTCTVWCYCTFSFSVHIERAKIGKKKSEINTKERREASNSVCDNIQKDREPSDFADVFYFGTIPPFDLLSYLRGCCSLQCSKTKCVVTEEK